jgi:hypothetical protein
LVEIDLLRGGVRPPLEQLPPCDYYVMVSRSETASSRGIVAFATARPAAGDPIPLRATGPGRSIGSAAVLHAIYDKARYATYIYDGSPTRR